MNTGIFGEGFPYSNFHDLNMDWIIKIAKDFLDQYSHIQQVIADGETSLQNLTTEGLQQLQDKADALEALLQAWYTEHSEDIANQLADALRDLNSWYTEHSQDIANELTTAIGQLDARYAALISNFNTACDHKAEQTIDSIPDDYTTVANEADRVTKFLPNIIQRVNRLNKKYFLLDHFVGSGGNIPELVGYTASNAVLVEGWSWVKIYPSNENQLGCFWGADGTLVSSITSSVSGIYAVPPTAKLLRISINSDYNDVAYVVPCNEDGYILPDLYNADSQYITEEYNYFKDIAYREGYIDVSGSEVAVPGYYVTDYIDVSNNTTGYMLTSIAWSSHSIECYGRSKNHIGTLTDHGADGLFKLPANTKYIRVNVTTAEHADETTILCDADEIGNVLPRTTPVTEDKANLTNSAPYNCVMEKMTSGGTMKAYGDSIIYGTTIDPNGQYHHEPTKTYTALVAQHFNKTYTAVANNGATFVSHNSLPCITDNILNDTDSSDTIFVCGGTNDYQGQTRVGKSTDTGTDTLYGCLYNICEHIKTTNPTAKVYFVTPANRYGTSDFNGNYELPRTIDEYRNAIIDMALRYGFNVIDGASFIPYRKYADNSTRFLLGDGLHPTEYGNKIFAQKIIDVVE